MVSGVAGFNTNTYRPVTLRFGGKAWSVVPVAQGRYGELRSVSTAGSSVWAVSNTGTPPSFVIHSAGRAWTIQTIGQDEDLAAVSAESANEAYAVGYTSGSQGARTLFARCNGRSWTVLASDI